MNKQSESKWHWLSLTTAVIVTVILIPPAYFTFAAGSYLLALGAAAFLITFGIMMYCNPDLWYRRMAFSAFMAMVATPAVGGMSLSIPVPGKSLPLEIVIPEAHFSLYIVLGLLIALFAIIFLRGPEKRNLFNRNKKT